MAAGSGISARRPGGVRGSEHDAATSGQRLTASETSVDLGEEQRSTKGWTVELGPPEKRGGVRGGEVRGRGAAGVGARNSDARIWVGIRGPGSPGPTSFIDNELMTWANIYKEDRRRK